jgi:hypothetical protein
VVCIPENPASLERKVCKIWKKIHPETGKGNVPSAWGRSLCSSESLNPVRASTLEMESLQDENIQSKQSENTLVSLRVDFRELKSLVEP